MSAVLTQLFLEQPAIGILGPYRVLRRLGRGGTADVFLAENTSMQTVKRHVALKVALPSSGSESHLIQEAFFLNANRHHPGIVKLQDVARSHGRTYLAMNWVRGLTLKQLLKRTGRIPLSTCVNLMIQLCDILSFIHGTGNYDNSNPIVHGDLKPANLIVDRFGQLTLIDFGMAQPSRTHLHSKSPLGTPAYIAPEQASQGIVDRRTDLYTLGLIGYELATGIRLFPGSDIPKLVHTRIFASEKPKRKFLFGRFNRETTRFMKILVRCINNSPRHRYQSAGDLAKHLHLLPRHGLTPFHQREIDHRPR
jgi:serine/threonine protein kinase